MTDPRRSAESWTENAGWRASRMCCGVCPGSPEGTQVLNMYGPLATIFAAGIYIGGGVILAILIILVLVLLLRRGA
jgi:hypothetical protein